MSRCERSGKYGIVVYNRHNFKNGKCVACNKPQTNIYPKPKRVLLSSTGRTTFE